MDDSTLSLADDETLCFLKLVVASLLKEIEVLFPVSKTPHPFSLLLSPPFLLFVYPHSAVPPLPWMKVYSPSLVVLCPRFYAPR